MPPSASGYLRYAHRKSPFHGEEKGNASDAKVKRNIRRYFCSFLNDLPASSYTSMRIFDPH